MCRFVKHTLSVTFFVTKLAAVYSSIRFDEVEFYDPNKTLDESTSNGFVCAHLGEECQITAQCCGVATCALPSWSETPVCLVPGYKHDQWFNKRFSSLHNLRPEDIHYIRDSYNSSQYDFLLSDLTFSAPPLDGITKSSSSEITAENVTAYNNTVDALDNNLGRDDEEYSSSAENVEENSQRSNGGKKEGNSIKLLANETLESKLNNTESVSLLDTLEDSDSINQNFSMMDSTFASRISGFDLKKHFKFLSLNNTLRLQNSKLDIKQVYDQIINTNKFKSIVERLREKMREINEMEIKLGTNKTENSTILAFNIRESDAPTTETTKTTQNISKWDVVKQFFLHKKERLNNNQNFTNKNNMKGIDYEITLSRIPTVNNQEYNSRNTVLQGDYPENPNNNEGFKKLIEDMDKIEEIIDHDRTIRKLYESKKVNDEHLFDFYNINVPLASFEGDPGRTGRMNSSLESVFTDLGNTIQSMIMKSNNEGKSVQGNLEVKKTTLENNAPPQFYKVLSEATTKANDDRIKPKIHFWDQIHLWKTSRNVSVDVERSFKKWFSTGWKSNTREKSKKLTPLNEYFLLNLNSKKNQETVTPKQTERTEKLSEYSSYLSSSESESSGAEEVYNNSYIFMMHKNHFEEPVKLSSWKKVINFFHKEKVAPVSRDLNIHVIPKRIPSNSESDPSQTEADSTLSFVKVPEIIRLPEYLMPQALDKRQGNETDWIFEDSNEDLEDRTAEEHKTSNSSFFFFLSRYKF